MKLILKKNIPNLEATKKLAKEFFETHLKNEKKFVVFLEGGLGTGKTVFIRELLKHLGIKEEIVSPTYVFVREYNNFAHFDFYRLPTPAEFFARGFEEIADDENISCFVEWPDKITTDAKKTFSGKDFTIQIKHGIGVGMRTIKILSY